MSLKSERTARHLTQAETAKKIGISERGYRYIESGNKVPSYNTIIQLEKLFEKPIQELLVPNSKEV